MKKIIVAIITMVLILSGYLFYASKKPADSDSDNASPPVGNRLDLSNQNLEKIPEYVFRQENLTELDVSSNRLTGAVQAEIRQLKNLKSLKASNNFMTGVPAEIGQLNNLEVLDLSNNRLTGLPYEIGNLKKLKIFNISGNNYSESDLNAIKRNFSANTEIIR